MAQKTLVHPEKKMKNRRPGKWKQGVGRIWESFKTLVRNGEEKSDLLNFTVLLVNMMTLLAWRTMDLAQAEYEGKTGEYVFCSVASAVILVALVFHAICMVGTRRWESIGRWLRSLPRVLKALWKKTARGGKICLFAVLLLVLTGVAADWFCPRTTRWERLDEFFGVPVGAGLTGRACEGLAGYWLVEDYPRQKRMTLTYVEAYGQLDLMAEYSTLYERAFFKPTAKIEITYEIDKDFYKSYPKDSYSAAKKIGYRVLQQMSCRNSGGKLVLALKRNSRGNMEITAYAPEDAPQLPNTTLLRIPEGQTAENGMIGQQIETVYASDGLPEQRRLYSRAYNLYGVNGERYSYDRDRQLSSLCYLNADGEPACNKLGIMMVEFQYRDDGRLETIRYYSDQNGSERVEGFHGVFCEILEYDDEGKNVTSRRQKDRSESWCFDTNGVYEYCYAYENGALAQESFLGVDEAPIQNSRFSSRWVKFRQEEEGRQLCVELEPVGAVSELRENSVEKAPAFPLNVDPFPGNFTLENNAPAAQALKNTKEADGETETFGKAAAGASRELPDEALTPNRNYSLIRYTLQNGVVERIGYWNGADTPALGEKGCAAIQFEYDGQHRIVRESYLDAGGRLCVLSGGYAVVENTYREGGDGDLECTAYLDAAGQPAINREIGCATVRFARSGAHQETVRKSFYDKEGRLMPLPDVGYAEVEQRYDANGFLIQETFYNARHVVACRTDMGVAKIQYEYGADGNLIRESYRDQAGRPTARRDTGYAVVNRTFSCGQLTETRYETCEGRAYVTAPDRESGVAIISYLYQNGQKVEEQYLDAERRPVLHSRFGCAFLQFEYRDGKLYRQSACGPDRELVLRRDTGCAIAEYVYDDFGRQKQILYYGTDEKLLRRKDTGYAEIRYAYDDLGRCTAIEYYGAKGERVIYSGQGYAGVRYEYPGGDSKNWVYLGLDGEPAPRAEGYGIVRVSRISGANGNMQWEKYGDADERPVVWKDHGYSAVEYVYDEQGTKIQHNFHDREGALTRRKDQGYAFETFQYDDAGRVKTRLYFDEYGAPAINTEYNCAGFSYEYDERGNQSVIRYIGLDGAEGVRRGYGFSEVRRSYDDAGNLTEERFYLDGEPAVWPERGYASYTDIFENGKCVESRYYDTEGALVLRADYGYAVVKRTWDAFGRCERELYYDTEGNPIISTEFHCAGFAYEYNPQGYRAVVRFLGTDGRPMVRRDLGYAEVQKEYDSAGHLSRESYFDPDGNPAVHQERGFSSFLDTFENGCCIRSEYFDTEGNPVVWKDQGNAMTRRTFDEFGRLTGVYYCDAAGELLINQKEGCAGYRYAYDELGNQTDTWYVSPEGEASTMIHQEKGYAHIYSEYDELGQETDIFYYLNEGRSAPAEVREQGYSRVKKAYEDGRCVLEEYCDAEGNPVLRSDTGYAAIRYACDAYGKRESILYLGRDLETPVFNRKEGCAGFQYTYDDNGNKTNVRCIGTDEQPVLRDGKGYAHIVCRYNDVGQCIQWSVYEDAEETRPAVEKGKGYVRYESDYVNGKCVETRYYDAQGQLTPRQDGRYAIIRYEYDAYGQRIAEFYFNADGTPATHSENKCAGLQWAYDEQGRKTDTWYLGPDKKPVCREDEGYAHIHSRYDAEGNETYVEFRDADERLTAHKNCGYAFAVYAYQDGKCVKGDYYNAYGEPVLRTDNGFAHYEAFYDKNGSWIEARYYDTQMVLTRRTDENYAIIRKTYDAWNRRTSVKYYDESDKLTMGGSYRCAGMEYVYDSYGNQIRTRYIGTDDNLVRLEGYGFAQVKTEYDHQGRQTWEWYLDENGDPVEWENRGYAGRAILYHDTGQEESRWYYDTEGKLTLRSDTGYAYVRMQYNDKGQLSREDYYGTEDERVLHRREHCASREYVYDARGNETYCYYYGIDQELLNREDTGASLRYQEYDAQDRKIWEGYYIHADGAWQLVNRLDAGYAAIEDSYNEMGVRENRVYRNADKEPIDPSELPGAG